jgi:LemA protein
MTLIIGAILGLIVLYVVFSYNGLIRNQNRAEEAWADIDVQLKRRYDLIPNLVSTVKGYANHEAATLEKVTQARNTALNAQGVHEKEVAETALSGMLKSVFALAESYPDLKANTNFLDLQKQLQDTEDKISMSRRFYNTSVRDLNTATEVFPSNLIAQAFGFAKKEYFELEDDAARAAVEVKF